MHFIKKVPTTDEEKAAKSAKQAAKLKMFCQIRDKIFGKRAYHELDEEILKLTEAILSKNPDIYTFWNIRRETLEEFERLNESKDKEIDLERFYVNELNLTELCITANPKSYSAWFQRGWILKRQSSPDLKNELALCEKALKLDCRNFHCWNHRNIVSKMANLTDEEELSFSQKLVAENFSNFSAWHMRMNLLPRMKSERTGENVLRDEDVKLEIKRVANAIFTDPEDQSAWMYARWIIDLYSPSSFFNEETSIATVPLAASTVSNTLIVSFTRPITVEHASSFFQGISEDAQWKSISLYSTVVSRVWQCTVDDPSSINISPDGQIFVDLTKPFVRKDLFDRIFAGFSVEVIDSIMNHCKELLEEEKSNSFALLTLTHCLRATDPLSSHQSIIDNLESLSSTIDPLRSNMYKSLISHERFRYALLTKEEGEEMTRLESILNGNGRLSLRYQNITEFHNLDIFAPLISDIDVRGNEIEDGNQLSLLPLLTSISIDENPIKSIPLSFTSLTQLEFISVGSCKSLNDTSSILPTISQLPSLKRFLYCETPLVDHTNEIREVVGDNVRLIPHYL